MISGSVTRSVYHVSEALFASTRGSQTPRDPSRVTFARGWPNHYSIEVRPDSVTNAELELIF